jgi:hypothetical protein
MKADPLVMPHEHLRLGRDQDPVARRIAICSKPISIPRSSNRFAVQPMTTSHWGVIGE